MRFPLMILLASFVVPISTTLSAGEPVEIARGAAPAHPQQPQVAVDAKGTIHLVYGSGDVIHYARSEDRGVTYSKPVALPPLHAMSLGMRRGPRIAVSDSAICITAIGGKQGKGRDGDVLAWRSADGGKTWLGPSMVNDVPDAAREGLHGMAAGPKGALCCVWLDLRDRQTEVRSSVSVDGGETWGKNTLVYQSPDGSVCECCHPSVAFDSAGQIAVLWRNSLGGARDMYAAASTDGGKTFGKATKLGSGSWALKNCPMDGGSLAASAAGKFATAWRREKTIYVTDKGSFQERSLSSGEQPWLAATAEGPFVIWLKSRADAVLMLGPGNKAPVQLAANAFDPVIAAAPDGRGLVVAAWEARDGKEYLIQCQVVGEVGKSRQ